MAGNWDKAAAQLPERADGRSCRPRPCGPCTASSRGGTRSSCCGSSLLLAAGVVGDPGRGARRWYAWIPAALVIGFVALRLPRCCCTRSSTRWCCRAARAAGIAGSSAMCTRTLGGLSFDAVPPLAPRSPRRARHRRQADPKRAHLSPEAQRSRLVQGAVLHARAHPDLLPRRAAAPPRATRRRCVRAIRRAAASLTHRLVHLGPRHGPALVPGRVGHSMHQGCTCPARARWCFRSRSCSTASGSTTT